MIDDVTKNKLIREIEKSGNVSISCLKLGIDKSSYYRWSESDKEFKKQARSALRRGRETNCDIAKHSLMLMVKEKKFVAVQYVLSHNDPVYKKRPASNVVIVHKKDSLPFPIEQKTLTELLREDAIDKLDKKYKELSTEMEFSEPHPITITNITPNDSG